MTPSALTWLNIKTMQLHVFFIDDPRKMKDQFWPLGKFRENDLCKSNFDPGDGKEDVKDSLENQSKSRILQMEDHSEDWSITNCASSLNKDFIIIVIQFWSCFF